ncbi:ciliary microtubule inner protein 4 [Lissotriton helveticus]
MGATVPSEVEGGSSQEKKSPDEKLEGDEPEDLQEQSKCCSYGDLTAVSNPAAFSIRLDSSSPLQALRNFARTPEKRVVIPKKEEEKEKKEEEEEKKVTEEVEMEENDIKGNEEPEASDQTLDPSSDSTNMEVPMVRSCSLGEAKAREARSKVVVQYPVKKDHSEEEVVPDETDEDAFPEDTQNKPGHSNVELPIPKEQEYVYSSQADGDKRTRSEVPEQKKRMNLSKTDCENAKPSSANCVELGTSEEEESCTSHTDAEDDGQKMPTAEEPKEVPVQVVCKEGMTPIKQQKPDFKVGKLEECTKTASAYKQLGQALRANNFPGMPIPMQTLSQETYTKEVSQKGLLEKSQSPHWHGKKTDDLGKNTDQFPGGDISKTAVKTTRIQVSEILWDGYCVFLKKVAIVLDVRRNASMLKKKGEILQALRDNNSDV